MGMTRYSISGKESSTQPVLFVETLNDDKIINANYDVVAEAEAILAEAALVNA